MTPLSVAFLLVVLAAFISGIYSWRWRRIPGLQAFILASLGIVLWAMGYEFAARGSDLQQSHFWLRVRILGIDLLPMAWLAFVLLYTRGKKRLSWLTWIGLLTLPVISQLTGKPAQSMTSIQSAFWIEPGETIRLIIIQHTVWGWAHLLVGTIILMVGGILLVFHLAHTPGIMRKSTRWIDIIALAPMVLYLVEITGIRVQSGLILTPLIFLVGQYAFLWSVNHGGYFQVLPEARDLLLEWMDNGILVLDREGIVIDVNPAAAALCNKPAFEMLGVSFSDLCPQLATILDQTMWQDTFQTEILAHIEQKTQWLDLRITPLYKDSRDTSGYMLEMQDVSRRRLAEDALRESEQRYRLVIDSMIEGVMVQDAEGSIIACNPNAELILAVSREEMLQHNPTSSFWRAIREDGSNLPGEEHPSMIALATGLRQANITLGLFLPDGGLRWLLINSQPLIKDNEGKPYAVVSTFVDITEDRKTEQILRDSENMFRSLLESAPVAILITNEDGNIQLLNASAEQLFGFTRAELRGEVIEKLIPERFHNGHVLQRSGFIRDSRSRPMGRGKELIARRKDGSEFLVDVGLNLIHTNNGTLVMSYLMDITERKQAEEALKQSNEQLVHSMVELETHNRELVTLTEMGDMLQICASVEEAYTIVASFAQKLFPDCSGALYMSIDSPSMYEMTIAWGEQVSDELTFTADMCWALRRGRVHSADFTLNTLACRHTDHLRRYGYTNSICLPMGALGEMIGLFHLRWKSPTKQPMIEQLAATVSEHITLSLSNLMLRENLRSQSIRDPLTGLFNRRYMEEAFNHELHRASRRSYSVGVIMLDVDHFKAINDCFGHAAGDNMLIALANYLKNHLRGEDILCRYGGEEFAIILPDTGLDSAVNLAEKIRVGIKNSELDLASQPYEQISISLGVAAYPEHGRNAEELLKSADWALYQAKQNGRDRVIRAQVLS